MAALAWRPADDKERPVVGASFAATVGFADTAAVAAAATFAAVAAVSAPPIAVAEAIAVVAALAAVAPVATAADIDYTGRRTTAETHHRMACTSRVQRRHRLARRQQHSAAADLIARSPDRRTPLSASAPARPTVTRRRSAR